MFSSVELTCTQWWSENTVKRVFGENMNVFIRNTLVVDPHTDERLTLDDIMVKMKEEIGQVQYKVVEVHKAILDAHPEADFRIQGGHKQDCPKGNYKLRWLTVMEKKERMSVLLCVSTSVEGDHLRGLLKMSDDMDIGDCDTSRVDIGFTANFSQVVAIGEASRWGGSVMYGMTKALVDIFPNLEKAYQTGPCDAPLNMGTIVVADQNIHGLVCMDTREESDWTVSPGFPSEALAQASHRAAQGGIPVCRSPMASGGRKMTEPLELPYSTVSGGFLCALHRTGFVGPGHEVGLASVVDKNFEMPELTTCSTEAATMNLKNFWKIFLDTL